MTHHKRSGPKSTRAGCLLCKPHKHQAEDRRTVQERRREPDMDEAETLLTDVCSSHGSQRIVSALLWAEHPEIWDTTA